MNQSNITISPYDPADRDALVSIWEQSVRATHHFLATSDIDFYKQLVGGIDFETMDVHCLRVDGALAGFTALDAGKIEMLFLRPQHIGKGFGKQLLQFAITECGATAVDVNEHNAHARQFYEAAGFSSYARQLEDPAGKPYPILQMRLK